ncbi:MAG: XdhC family protein [Spirochaetia bacterium]
MSYEIMKAIAGSRSPAALVTIIDVRGSVPRHPGTKMLVRRDAAVMGTVGGARGEAAAIAAAKECIQRRQSTLLTVEMQGTEAVGQEMICGGTNRMLIEYVGDTRMYRAAFERLRKGERVLFLKKIDLKAGDSQQDIAVSLFDENGAPAADGAAAAGAGTHNAETLERCLRTAKPVLSEDEGLFYDPAFPEEKLLILGGGHVGRALAGFAASLDFTVTVADDRQEFAAPGRFPPSVATQCGRYEEVLRDFPFDAATYVVIVTRGHLYDLECVRAVLGRRCRYAGFIGSARKTRLLLEQVRSEGFPAEKIEALHAPIGVDIRAETPEEIAISILGEMIAVRRNTEARGSISGGRGAGGSKGA